MSALLEYECRVPVGGYEVVTIEHPGLFDQHPPTTKKIRMLQARSKRTRRFDLFEFSSSAFVEFAQTPLTEHGIRDFADRYGPLADDPIGQGFEWGRTIYGWSASIREMHRTVKLW